MGHPELVPIQKELSAELKEYLKEARKGKKTIAIVGFAPTTRDLAPYDDLDVEIWSLNEAYHYPWMKRWDRWFQIHKPWSYQRPENRNDPEHWEWLQQDHDFPIYMQDVDPDVPASVKLPLQEIIDTFLPNVRRGSGDICEYFTSSYAYLCSFALWLWKQGEWGDVPLRIETYGFEMSTMTEYHYQKGSTEGWMMYASALGVDVWVPDYCKLLHGLKYGYEVTQMINRQELEFRQKQLAEMEAEKVSALNNISGRRQEVEGIAQKAQKKLEASRKRLMKKPESKELQALVETQGEELKEIGQRHSELVGEEVHALSNANAISGGLQEIGALISYIDTQYKYNDSDDPRVPVPMVNLKQVGKEPDTDGEGS